MVFGGSAILAASLKSAAIYTALGASCFTFFGVSLAQAQADGDAGYYDLMFLDVVFSALSLKGSKSCFDNAYNVSTASNTAKSSTNTSTQNTNTAKNSSNSSSNETKTLYRGERSSVKPNDAFQNGFSPKGTHNDPLLHTKSNATAGNFISTSCRQSVAEAFTGKHGYVYVIETRNYIDINMKYGTSAYYPEQFEYSIPGGISPSEIVGAYPMNNGVIDGSFIPNSNYRGA